MQRDQLDFLFTFSIKSFIQLPFIQYEPSKKLANKCEDEQTLIQVLQLYLIVGSHFGFYELPQKN